MLLFYYNVRALRFIVRAALPPITDNLRAAQSPTHSANIRKCKIITKFAIINGGWILRVDTFQAVSACGKKSFCGEFHIVITLGGRKNSEKMRIL